MNEFSALVVVHPKQAAEKLVAVYTKARACQEDAAAACGVCINTWMRWVERLDLSATLEAVAEKARAEGWHHGRVGGRPTHRVNRSPKAPRTARRVT